jgi:hypothetical protein
MYCTGYGCRLYMYGYLEVSSHRYVMPSRCALEPQWLPNGCQMQQQLRGHWKGANVGSDLRCPQQQQPISFEAKWWGSSRHARFRIGLCSGTGQPYPSTISHYNWCSENDLQQDCGRSKKVATMYSADHLILGLALARTRDKRRMLTYLEFYEIRQ